MLRTDHDSDDLKDEHEGDLSIFRVNRPFWLPVLINQVLKM